MSTLIRPSFHVLTLVLIACVCVTLAQTVNLVLSASLLPLPSSPWSSEPQVATSATPSPALSVELLARYTGLSIAERPLPPTSAPAETPPTQLALKLLGTMMAAEPDLSLASIYEDPSQRTRTVRVGSSLQGAEIIAIERTRVVLLNAGRTEILDAGPGRGVQGFAPVTVPSQAPAVASSGFGATIRQTGPETYTIQRQDVENTLANMAQLASHARVVPSFNGGISRGFKLFAMRPDSIYTRLGLKNGDVLQRINGFSLDSPTRALEAYNHLKDAARIELEIERDGQPLRKTFAIE
jgi:general secretion pathway protein C